MKNYKYVAINLQKKKFTGLFLAEDEKDLAMQLSRQNLFLVSCTPYTGKTPSSFFTTGTGQVSMSELTVFCREFAIMINAGISVVECISCLKDQSFSSFFKNLLQVIYEDVKSGVQLSESLNKHDKVFPELFRSMVYVGEASGKLDMVFDALAEYYDRDADMRRKVKGALSYPIMLGVMTIGIVILMMVLIIPIFKDTLSSLDIVPSGFTKIVYDISDFLVANWLYMLAIVVVIGLIIFFVLRTEKGKLFFDRLKVNIPVINTISIYTFSSRFARAFSLLLSSGLDMSEALDAAAVVIENTEMKRRFALATDEIKHGATLTATFTKYKLFPQIMLQMVAVGEKTAELEQVLSRSCSFFDTRTEEAVSSFASKLQPIMLCIMGAVIGSLFVAVYSPMISIMTNIT